MDFNGFAHFIHGTQIWFLKHVWTTPVFIESLWILGAFVFSRHLYKPIEAWLNRHKTDFSRLEIVRFFLRGIQPISFSVLFLLLLSVSLAAAKSLGMKGELLGVAVNLSTAWVLIRIVSSVAPNNQLSRGIAILAWGAAALNILGLLQPIIGVMDDLAFRVGTAKLSVLLVVKAILAFSILFWLAIAMSASLEKRLRRSTHFTPSIKVLLGKILRISFLAIAFLFSLSLIGVDLTALAVLSGGIGVGLGFGLQRIFGNLISGFILLMDKSIKPGDIIEIGNTFGSVVSLGGRYASIKTLRGTEHLIPNESLITEPVINWSHSDTLLRVDGDIGVSYDSDIEQVIEICIAAMRGVDRVLDVKEPRCHIKEFGDNAIVLSIRFWINDPENGIGNIRGAIFLAIWKKFKEHGIQIPFPQRDLHLKTMPDDFKKLA